MDALYQLIQPWVRLKRKFRQVPLVTTQVDPNANAQYEAFHLANLTKVPERIVKRYLAYDHKEITVSPCPSKKRLAVIVPYRKRESHRKTFTDHMLPFLESQGIEARVLIINQADQQPFNRGALCNIGFQIASKWADYVVIHDIDMLPADANYRCVNHPARLINYGEGVFSGVTLFQNEDFVRVNGFSNGYWHWGWEDVDLRDRCFVSGLVPIVQVESKYQMLPHEHCLTRDPDGTFQKGKKGQREGKRRKNRNRDRYLSWAFWGNRDHLSDGLNSLQFEHLSFAKHPLYTQYDVSLDRLWAAQSSRGLEA